MQRLSNWFRKRRDKLLRDVIAQTPRTGDRLRILDLGGRGQYWHRFGLDWLRNHGVTIDIVNLTDMELVSGQNDEDVLRYAIGNACHLDYPDDAFDLCHANSVVEHVGRWEDMEMFAGEVRRVAPSYFIQSPNFWFPVDPHFWRLPLQHWLPRPARARLMHWLPLATSGRAPTMLQAYAMVDSSRMLSRRQMATLFPDAQLHAERILLAAKSYTAIRIRDTA